jgi:putative tryptophan/tyrosine transport system substrate-binding protein
LRLDFASASPYGPDMDRRGFVLTALAGLIAAPLGAGGQPMRKAAEIVILGPGPTIPANLEAFRQGLGSTVARANIEQRHADGMPTRLPAIAAEAVRAGADVLFVRGAPALEAAFRATKTIPIVAIDLESDPVAMGYAKTLGRPGGNVTGVFLDLPDVTAKQLQLFKEILPSVSRVAVIGDAMGNATQFQATKRAALSLGLQIQTFDGRTAADIDAALEAARQQRSEVALVLSSPLVQAMSTRIATVAREKRLPTMSLFTELPAAGGLLAYGPSVREAFRRCAAYVAKIVNGARPADLPIDRPEKFELVINLKTAKALGLTIPASLLLRADQVIE